MACYVLVQQRLAGATCERPERASICKYCLSYLVRVNRSKFDWHPSEEPHERRPDTAGRPRSRQGYRWFNQPAGDRVQRRSTTASPVRMLKQA